MKTELQIQLHCTDFPGASFDASAHIFLAVQKNNDLESETPGDSQHATFDIPVIFSMGKDGLPNFTGPYVFGTTGDKFLYLVWYAKTGEFVHRFRRAKIKLNALSQEQIHGAIERGMALVAYLKMTDKKGGPVCASLKAPNIRWGSDE